MRYPLLLTLAIICAIGCKKSENNTQPAVVLPENYLSATINGDTVKGSTSSANRGFSAQISNTAVPNKIMFTVDQWYTGPGIFLSAPAGTYDLSTGTYIAGQFSASYATVYFNNDVYHTDATHTGSLTITNAESRTITGTFHFTATDSAGKTINVANGIFNKVKP